MQWLFFLYFSINPHFYYASGVIMSPMPSQISSLTIFYSAIYLGADKKNIKVTGLCEVTGDRWIPRTQGQLLGKCFHLMTSSWTIAQCLVDRLKINMPSYQYRDPITMIRRSWDRLIFIMGIAISGKTAFILRRGPGPARFILFCCCILLPVRLAQIPPDDFIGTGAKMQP